jgi:hypothetical protein
MKQCFEGWSKDDGNNSGRCCCNCQYQIEIMRHPWNSRVGGRMKGPISENAGWGCMMPDFTDGSTAKAIFFEREHSVCEMHAWKKVKQNENV